MTENAHDGQAAAARDQAAGMVNAFAALGGMNATMDAEQRRLVGG